MRLAPGLHRIGSDFVNCYLVEDPAGVTIIDAGLPGQWRELEAELAGLGRSLDDVRGIVLTHGDTDHIGFAEQHRQRTGVAVHVHELDAARGRHMQEVDAGAVGLPLVQRAPWRAAHPPGR